MCIRDSPVGADRAGPVAHLRDEGGTVDASHRVPAVVDQEKVVAAPVQLRKRNPLPRHRPALSVRSSNIVTEPRGISAASRKYPDARKGSSFSGAPAGEE